MRRGIVYTVIIIAIGVLWQWAASRNSTVRLLVSSPSLIVDYFRDNTADLLLAARTTLVEALAGLTIAVAFSFAMMIACFYKPKLMDYLLPVMITSQVIPLVVLAPFFIILLGIGLSSKIAMAALLCFFPVFVNFAQGYKAISENTHNLMYIYNAPLWFRIRRVYFPLSMPSIMAGLKVSATLSIIGAIVAEFSGAEVGLGKNLYISALRLEPDLMMSSLFLAMALGLALYGAVSLFNRLFSISSAQ